MRWDPYIKNKDISKEKWKLIDEWLELMSPPKILLAKCKQSLKKLSIHEIEVMIAMIKKGEK
jgi:hypothetical protein